MLRYAPETIGQRPTQHSMLRVFTFDHLGLEHTCHNMLGEDFDDVIPCSERDALDTQDLEHDGLLLLEDLLLEFETVLNNFEGTFLEFIEGMWTKRMDAVMSERNTPDEQDLRQMGVSLCTTGPKELSRTEDLLYKDIYSWEWFQWMAEKSSAGVVFEDFKYDDTDSRRRAW